MIGPLCLAFWRFGLFLRNLCVAFLLPLRLGPIAQDALNHSLEQIVVSALAHAIKSLEVMRTPNRLITEQRDPIQRVSFAIVPPHRQAHAALCG
jgi:hypothetical protein